MKINLFNETNFKIKKSLISKIGKVFLKLDTCDFSSKRKNRPITLLKPKSSCNLILKTKKDMINLNKQFFNRNTATDVISVNSPPDEKQGAFLGDIYICPQVIKENAKIFKVNFNEEITRVIIHGILHILGFDHKKPFEKSKEKMFIIQEKLLKKLSFF